jgi:ribose 5-phosphate isomerase B
MLTDTASAKKIATRHLIIGSDHAGFDLKEECRLYLVKNPMYRVFDQGVYDKQSADYPDIAKKVAMAVLNGEYEKGILICGSGIGMSITANRYRGIRAALCHDLYTARLCRQHNDANILVMGGRVIGTGIALEMVELFLNTEFEGGRHKKRTDLIDC